MDLSAPPATSQAAATLSFMFSTEEQEKQYRNIASDGSLHTRLMFFDLMQIAAMPASAQ